MTEQDQVPTKLVRHGYEYYGLPREIVLAIEDPVALAIYTYLQARGEDWQPQRNEILGHFEKLGKPTYQRAWKYLQQLGLGWITDVRDNNGRVAKRIMNVTAIPLTPEQRAEIDRIHTQSQDSDFRYRGEQIAALKAVYTGDLFENLSNHGTQSQDPESESTQSQDAQIKKPDIEHLKSGSSPGVDTTQSQESDLELRSNGARAPTQSQDSQSQKPDQLDKDLYINNSSLDGQDPDIESTIPADALPRDWTPSPFITNKVQPGIPKDHITEATQSFIQYWRYQRKVRPANVDANWLKHVHVTWNKKQEQTYEHYLRGLKDHLLRILANNQWGVRADDSVDRETIINEILAKKEAEENNATPKREGVTT